MDNFTSRVVISIFIGLALNSIYNSLAVAFGYDFPSTSFLFQSSDLFADFFKTNFAIAHEIGLSIDQSHLPPLIRKYLNLNPYQGISSLESGKISVSHLPPLTMLVLIFNIFLMKSIGAMPSFLLLFSLFLACIFGVLRFVGLSIRDSAFWLGAFFFSYPILFLITRGNLLSGLVTLALFVALFLFIRGNNLLVALLLMSFAINLRPNLAIFLFVVFIGPNKINIKNLIFCLTMIAAFFCTSLLVVHMIISDYSLSNFLIGLNNYHHLYVDSGAGVPYGSSLYGALWAIFGYHRYFELTIFIFGLSLLLYVTVLHFFSKIDLVEYIFILCALCCLMTTIFADYHLTIFFLPLLLLYLHDMGKFKNLTSLIKIKSHYGIFVTCLVLLVPKNFAFYRGEISWQVVLNLLILLLTIFLIFAYRRVGNHLVNINS